jgi:hypothetical protein
MNVQESNKRLNDLTNKVINLSNNNFKELSELCPEGIALEVLFAHILAKRLMNECVDDLLKNCDANIVNAVVPMVDKIKINNDSFFIKGKRKDIQEMKDDVLGQ